jgi:hypothetical protein
MKRRDEELPRFRHGFQSAATQAVGIYGNAAPSVDAEALLFSGVFDGGFGVGSGILREKGEAYAELVGELDSLFCGFGAEEGFWECGEKAGTVAAGAIGVNSTAMGEAFEGG